MLDQVHEKGGTALIEAAFGSLSVVHRSLSISPYLSLSLSRSLDWGERRYGLAGAKDEAEGAGAGPSSSPGGRCPEGGHLIMRGGAGAREGRDCAHRGGRRGVDPSTLNPKPSTLNPQP